MQYKDYIIIDQKIFLMCSYRTWEKEISKVKAYTITGYPTPKDFYLPDYSKHKNDITSDYWKTLLWQPYVKTGK